MSTRYRLSPIAIKLSESNAVPERIQVMRVGNFHHDKYGKFEITKQHLLSFKKNFDSGVRGVDLAIDYSHNSEDVAAGWFKDLELSEDGNELWAKIDWTKNGKRVLEEKEFRYVSGDFTYDYKDNETLKTFGPTLLGAGLTNRPVIKGQAPVVELAEGKGPETMDPKDKEIAELKAKIAELEAKLAGKSAGDVELSAEKAKVVAAEQQLAEMKAANLKLSEEKSKLENETKLAEKKAKFDLKLSEGTVVEAQREAFMSDDMAKFVELAQPVKMGAAGHGAQGGSGKSAQDEVMELAEKKIEAKTAGDMRSAISIVLSENADLRKRYEAQA